MRRFSCPVCQSQAHFANTLCLACGTNMVFDPVAATMLELGAATPCANRDVIACNWRAALPSGTALPDTSAAAFCESCAATETIPDLSVEGNVDRWTRVETAKRQLYYMLIALNLPRISPSGNALSFAFMADAFAADGAVERVLTGHEDGRITLNIAEADDDEREARRVAMGEPYRTLVGHLRHEVGHFYWDVLIADAGLTQESAAVFGDADADYTAALKRHYAEGAPMNWQDNYISSYATAHPWEDWAETWAHTLHIIDGLDTARHNALDAGGMGIDDAYASTDGERLVAAWVPLASAMNAMNRSMGQPDFYPFVISAPVKGKIGYILGRIHAPG